MALRKAVLGVACLLKWTPVFRQGAKVDFSSEGKSTSETKKESSTI